MLLELLHSFSELVRAFAQTRAREARMQAALDISDNGLEGVFMRTLEKEPCRELMIPADPEGEASGIQRVRERHARRNSCLTPLW